MNGSYLNEGDLLKIKEICEALQKDTMPCINVHPAVQRQLSKVTKEGRESVKFFDEILKSVNRTTMLPVHHRFDGMIGFLKKPDTQRRYVEIGKILDGLTVQEARWLLGWLHQDVAIYGVHELLRDVMKEKEEKEEAEPPGSSTADKIMNDFLKKGEGV